MSERVRWVVAGALLALVFAVVLWLLPVSFSPFKGTISRDDASSKQQPASAIAAPAGAPNVLLILVDDAGYGQTSTFGGLIPTPTLDSLASSGLRFTRFHVTALCSPTRAALLTGRNSHAVGMGTITNWSTEVPGTPRRFQSPRRSSPRSCARTGTPPRASASGT
jgi:hypothetical protein